MGARGNFRGSDIPAASLNRFAFVRVRGRTDGIGKLIEPGDHVCVVEYFASPAGPDLKQVKVPTAELEEVELSPETRVYWLDKEVRAWRVGRVVAEVIDARALNKTENHYLVRFPNGRDELIPQSQLYVRWSHPVEDPTAFLAAQITETPFFFEGRRQLISELAAQRAGFGGLSGLASSAIELLPHQVATVRRVLGDPIERYLLADEVGLGKTVEAGVLIRQHIIDFPQTAKVLVVVPDHLVHQWRAELAAKFFLFKDRRIVVASEREVTEFTGTLNISMLVVDEAQRSAIRAFHPNEQERRLFRVLKRLAEQTPRVILLSGTPVLHQEDGFLAMLHLLDPHGYRLEDRKAFRRRVRERQLVADAILDLADDATALFAEEALDRLASAFTDDERLMSLLQSAREVLQKDEDDEDRIRALQAIRTHLSELYRLHRRLLRTRRDDPRVKDLLPKRTGAISISCEDPARQEAFAFVEQWRDEFIRSSSNFEAAARALFTLWVECALSHPVLLLRHIEARLALLAGGEPTRIPPEHNSILAIAAAFDQEVNCLSDARRLLATAVVMDGRAQQIAQYLQEHPEVPKAILFVDQSEIADLVATHIARILGPDKVLRHQSGSDSERVFEETSLIRILVCDATAEEGLNLQRVGAAVVHYDLPVAPTRIEQRIGRVDRIEARGRLRNVIFSSNCPYEGQWTECLNNTIGIFRRSVAPLQYLLVETANRIRDRLLDDGPEAIEAAEHHLQDPNEGLDAELRRIRAQEALDSFEVNTKVDEDFFDAVEQADIKSEETGDQAFDAWVVDRLRFIKEGVHPASFRYSHDYRHPTLVPLHEVVTRFAASIDRDPASRETRTRLAFRPMTSNRIDAEKHSIELLRIGNPFVDATESLLRSDDRGMAFAMWRQVRHGFTRPELFFAFHFFVEADLSTAVPLIKSRGSEEALRRRADTVFSPKSEIIWLDSDLKVVGDISVLTLLSRPFSREQRKDGTKDLNIRLERWGSIANLFPLSDWGELCERARRASEEYLVGNRSFQDYLQRCATSFIKNSSRTNEAFESRIARLTGTARTSEAETAEFERRIADAVVGGIRSPAIRVDSVGAVFVCSSPLPHFDELEQ